MLHRLVTLRTVLVAAGAAAWVASTRNRLRQADRALSGLRPRAGALVDEPVARQVQRHDHFRPALLAAFSGLLYAVNDGVDEQSAQQVLNRRLRSYQREGRRLADLMEPYFTDEQCRVFRRAGGA